jgi:hypothetical protein
MVYSMQHLKWVRCKTPRNRNFVVACTELYIAALRYNIAMYKKYFRIEADSCNLMARRSGVQNDCDKLLLIQLFIFFKSVRQIKERLNKESCAKLLDSLILLQKNPIYYGQRVSSDIDLLIGQLISSTCPTIAVCH